MAGPWDVVSEIPAPVQAPQGDGGWNVVSEAPAPSVAADVAKSGGIGLAKGAIGLAGMAGDIPDLIGMASDKIAGYLGMDPAKIAADRAKVNASPLNVLPTSESIQNRIEGVTGKFYEPQTSAGKYAQTVGEFAPAAVGGAEGMGARLLRMTVAPAVASEAAGQATEGTAAEPYARALGAAAGGGAAALLKGGTPSAVAPTAQELKAAAQAGYQHPEVAAVEIKPQAVTHLAQQIESDLAIRGFRPTSKSASDTFAEVRGLQVPPGVQSVKVADIDTARKALGNLSKEVDAIGQPTTEAAAAKRAISKIDDFLPSLQQSDLLAGDAAKANDILTEARGNYKAYKQASLIDTKQANAELQAASTYGGGNINNATRQAFRPLLKNNAAGLSGFSPEAEAQANRVVTGGPVGNVMRQVGRLAPTGPVNMGLHVGAALGTGGATIPVAVGAHVVKKVGEAITRSEVAKLNDILRSQSPLARATVPPVPSAPAMNPRLVALMNAALSRQPGAPVVSAQNRQPAISYP